jgi:hypothetical protein
VRVSRQLISIGYDDGGSVLLPGDHSGIFFYASIVYPGFLYNICAFHNELNSVAKILRVTKPRLVNNPPA